MQKTLFNISKMDCPSEENMIRLKLDDLTSIHKLSFEYENRNLTIYHSGEPEFILARLDQLKLGTTLSNTAEVEEIETSEESTVQYKLLWSVLLINFSFFVIEMTTGLFSKSMGLVADSLDMLADSFVYGLSLWAVGSTAIRKKRVARLSGYFQLSLALLGLLEVIRRFISFESIPDFRFMIIVSFFALAANMICLILLQKSRSKEVHMKASMIFTSNDVVINTGVIIAGILVLVTNSKYPDLIIGTMVF